MSAFLPLGRADLARMGGDILCSPHLVEQGRCAASYAPRGDFDILDASFGVDQEGRTICHAGVFDHHIEITRNRAGRIGEHDVIDLADSGRRIVPGLVRDMLVGRDRVDLDAQLLELCVAVGQIFEFGWADKAEIGRIKENDGPFSFEVLIGNGNEFTATISICRKEVDG